MEDYPEYAKFEYYVSFGRGDASNTIEWEEKMTPEEAAIYVQAHRDGECLEDIAELSDLYDRAYAAIEETATSDLSDYYYGDEEDEDYDPLEHYTLNVSFAEDDDCYEDDDEADEEEDEDEA